MSEKRATPEELALEAAAWAEGTLTLEDWKDALDAVPRHMESTPISIRLPSKMLDILREFARRRGIGYQVLMKQWLRDRIREEAESYLESRKPQGGDIPMTTPTTYACEKCGEEWTVNPDGSFPLHLCFGPQKTFLNTLVPAEGNVCPAGGEHESVSKFYMFQVYETGHSAQVLACKKCSGLFWVKD